MSATPQSPQEALRGFSHAVILTADGGPLGAVLQHAVDQVGLKTEILGHPLTAMASLCWHEFNGRRAGDRSVLVVADRPIDDLDLLFSTIAARLPHVHALMLQSDLVMSIITGRPRAETLEAQFGSDMHIEHEAIDDFVRRPQRGLATPSLRIAPSESRQTPKKPTTPTTPAQSVSADSPRDANDARDSHKDFADGLDGDEPRDGHIFGPGCDF